MSWSTLYLLNNVIPSLENQGLNVKAINRNKIGDRYNHTACMRKNTSRTIRIISRVGISGQTVASISTCDSCCDCVTVSLLRIRSLVRHVTDSSPRSGVRDLMSQRTSVCLQALTFPSIKLNFARIF